MSAETPNEIEPRFRCNGKAQDRSGRDVQCWLVGTVEIDGKRYCLTCAKATGKRAAK